MFSLSRSECSIWLALLMTKSVVIVTFNSVTIFVFMRNRSLRKRGMSLVINLAVADMLSGGFAELMLFIAFGRSCNLWKYDVKGHWHIASLYLLLLLPVSSLTTIAAISLKQLHATFRPFQHRVIRKWVYGIVIAVVWVVAATVASGLFIVTAIFFYFWISSHLFCLFVICVSYASIAVKFHWGRNHHLHGAANRERKLTVTLFIMTLLSLLVYLPYVIFTILYLTSDSLRSLSKLAYFRLNLALDVLYFTNSLVNPILYAIRMPEFKSALLSLFRCQTNPVAENIPHRVLPPWR